MLDPESPDTFGAAVLDWDELDAPERASMLAWYRALLALRSTSPHLLDDRVESAPGPLLSASVTPRALAAGDAMLAPMSVVVRGPGTIGRDAPAARPRR